MIEFEHLFQFVAFGMYGTLSKQQKSCTSHSRH